MTEQMTSDADQWASDPQALTNARNAYADVRTQVDHQIRNADSLDTKATAVITAIGVLAGLTASRLHFESGLQQISGLVTFVVALAAVTCAVLAVKPRDGFSFGPNPDDLVKDNQPERFDDASYALGMLSAIVESRRENVQALEQKARWFQLSLWLLLALVFLAGWLVAIGGIQ